MRNFISILQWYHKSVHYKCVKYRVLCLNLMTFDCMGHSFLRKGREGFLRAWWEIMTLHGWFSSAWQLSFHLDSVKPWAFTHSDLRGRFVSLPNTWVLRHSPINSNFFALNLWLWVEGFLCMSLHLRLRQCMHASVGLCVWVRWRGFITLDKMTDRKDRLNTFPDICEFYWCTKHHALCDWSSIRQNKSLTAMSYDLGQG